MNHQETDEELTQIIAEKVMGVRGVWVDVPPDADGLNAGRTFVPEFLANAIRDRRWSWPPQGEIGERFGWPDFSPLLDDNDCMAAWDRFSEGRNTEVIHDKLTGAWTASYEIDGGACPTGDQTDSQDRRRAMCALMAMALKDS